MPDQGLRCFREKMYIFGYNLSIKLLGNSLYVKNRKLGT